MVARQREIIDRCLGWQPRRFTEGGDIPPYGATRSTRLAGCVIACLGGRGAAFKNITLHVIQYTHADTRQWQKAGGATAASGGNTHR